MGRYDGFFMFIFSYWHIMKIVFDIETNSFVERQRLVHCLEVHELQTDLICGFNDHGSPVTLAEGYELLQAADSLIGHNIVAFDLRQISKVSPDFRYDPKCAVDTLVLSRQLFPAIEIKDRSEGWLYQFNSDNELVLDGDGRPMPILSSKGKSLIGSHSLEAWGHRLGFLKGSFGATTTWACWTEEMQSYCRQDVVVSKALYHHLMEV